MILKYETLGSTKKKT